MMKPLFFLFLSVTEKVSAVGLCPPSCLNHRSNHSIPPLHTDIISRLKTTELQSYALLSVSFRARLLSLLMHGKEVHAHFKVTLLLFALKPAGLFDVWSFLRGQMAALNVL